MLFNDLLLFLQKCELDDVASVLIGYDFTGEDILFFSFSKWNFGTIPCFLFFCLIVTYTFFICKVKTRVPLFKLVRSASYDKVLAVETCLTTRDITVAEGRFGCLQVTRVNGANIPLKEQDCFLEINDKPGQLFRSPLMFTKLISDAAGEPIRLVVLRRRMLSDNGFQDAFSASSGVSSSEISSDAALQQPEEKKAEVLRF
uniref:PDZ domain-containing protein n=1 Tax=Syphacia muris TaxID=451379 RepID=A0A0N5AY19_9BILA